MKAFLEYVADDLIRKYGTNLSGVAVVFPNKRASLFMNEYLARKADRPLWSPAYTTISDLFRQLSPLQVGDPLKLVCDLYRVYTEQTGIDDTLDHFFGWGQILLADFDDIDKKMADADKVFANLRDIHELDGIDYLTDEQKQIIKQFFGNFSDDQNSLIKERFLRLWSKLGDIYHAYNQLLERQGLAYEGALYRRVVTELVTPPDDRLYVFVGFNVLQDVEQQLFSFLMK
ncbi:MAG: PD-(D/E)XK nuclease family protein, partial [Prevotella sp.]|nr:PD-(D/E)XK nuclease family protein [Prevotella sp.]